MDAARTDRAVFSAVAELMDSVGEGLPRVVVAAEVLMAARGLRGSVPDGSQQELLYRLAAHRIALRTVPT